MSTLEQQVVDAPLTGIVLRYGKLYGPATGFNSPPSGGALHVDAAADAARRAITRGKRGIYNIAENDGTISSLKAESELGWSSGFRNPTKEMNRKRKRLQGHLRKEADAR